MNNPVSLADWNGKDIYLVMWKTDSDNWGHAGLAYDIKDANGNPTGTYAYMDLWPTESIGMFNYDEDVTPYYQGVVLNDLTKIDKNDFDNSSNDDIQEHKPSYPDGIIKIPTNTEDEKKILQKATSFQNDNKSYNGESWNCSSFVSTLIQQAYPNFLAIEYIKWSKMFVSTPHKLFQSAKKIEGAEVIKDPGEDVQEGFESATSAKSKKSKKKE
jgi:hypothetical protein